MKTYFVALFLAIPSVLLAQLAPYPTTHAVPIYDTFQNLIIADEYKWLEKTESGDVKAWVKQQNLFTDKFFSKNTRILSIEESISDIANVNFNLGEKQGSYYFKLLYNFKAPTPSLYMQRKLKDPPQLLVDPRDISLKDRIEIRNFQLSNNERYLAYQYCKNGTDWNEIRIVDLNSKRDLKETLVDVKFSDIHWSGNGFFYSRYKRSSSPFSPVSEQIIWYHAIKTPQSQDLLIFSGSALAAQIEIDVTSDEKFLIITEDVEELGSKKIFYRDLSADSGENKLMLEGEAAEISIIDSYKDRFIAVSNYENNNGCIISFFPAQPHQWNQIVNEIEDAVIVEAKVFDQGIITIVQSNLSEYMFIYDWEGTVKKILTFATGYKVSGILGTNDKNKLLFYYSSFTLPPVVYELDLQTYQYKKTSDKTVVSYDYEEFEYESITYPSKDGTLVPMLLLYKKGIKRNGNNPVLLESYGGFGVVARPNFQPGLVHFLNEAGIFAYAYIRGEGVKGSKWMMGGRGINKQNSFDDFIAAGEYLIKAKYTNPSKLAITGGSNGGLVVAVAITQRPDLFKAAIPVVGVFDMLHFENETVGIYHKDEYGTTADSALFRKLYSYSPLQNIKSSNKYPALLIVTSENDDRVPPYHSFKFAAKLQQISQQNPVLLRVIPKAGHNGANTWEGKIKSSTEKFAFILKELKD